MAICGYATPSGPCERTVADETDICFMHSGDGTPPGHGAPPGNQNAIGNSGGGPPAGNANAAKYHGWSDPHLHYERLESDAKEYVDERTELYVDHATADLPPDEIEEKAQLLATLDIRAGCRYSKHLTAVLLLNGRVRSTASSSHTLS